MTDLKKGIGIGTAAVIILLSLAILVFGARSVAKAAGITSPPSWYSYIVATQSVDSPEFRYALAFSQGEYAAVTSQISDVAALQTAALGTTTPCSLKDPITTASSTILSYAFNVTVGTSTPSAGINFVVGTSTSPYSTTTGMVANHYVPAGQQAMITWDPGIDNGAIGPNVYINVGMQASSSIPATGLKVTATCQATLQGVNA